uniref:Proliferating cell nuclear antigen PCNA N-terminal domain-containing protein n=1 Tax=viral metagenome TaxID=1070528 RepID=A0A6C0IV71_9ZZZZ
MEEQIVKKKRGRPPKNSASDEESSDNDANSEDKVLSEFTGGPRISPTATITKPEYGKNEPYMWFVTTQVSHMATLFKTLSHLLPTTTVVFGDGGWRITDINSNKTAIISLRVTGATMAAGVYECNTNYRVRWPVDDLATRLRMCRRAEVMAMELRGKNPKHLHLIFSQENRITEMDLQLCSVGDEQLDPPTLLYHTQVDLPADQFRDVVNSVKGDSMIRDITFTKHSRKFTITVQTAVGPISTHFIPNKGEDSVRFLARHSEQGQLESVTNDDGDVLKSTLSLKEIIDFSGVTKASKWVSINMPEFNPNAEPQQIPLRMSYSIAALGVISFLLAPKMDEDEPPATTGNSESNDEDE